MSSLLVIEGIVKTFGAVQALKGVDFTVDAGEVVVLLGENGAGKSTLLKTITGINQPDGGTILWQGTPVTLDTPAKAQSLGIRMVYQELNLAPHLSVAANICLGNEPTKAGGLLDYAAARERAKRILEAHRFDRLGIDPDARVGDLGPAQRQLVEICKALAADAKLLLLDEPTSSLGEREIEDLFATIRDLKARGLGIVYVSHRLPECFAIGDRIVVLRDGAKVYESPIRETDTATIVRQMVGRDLADYYPREAPLPGDVRLTITDLQVSPSLNGVSLTARAGEVVGIMGLLGSGRSSLLSAVFGLRPATGTVNVDGRYLPLGKGPKAAIRSGVALVTEDRKRTGLALGLPVRHNITLAALGKIAPGPWLSQGRDRAAARGIVERLGVKTASTETPVGSLSGGNQQKAVFGRWLFAESSVLLLDEPTRGVDVGSKVELYQRINAATKEGATVLLVSSELPELLGMSDRVLVLHLGHLVADLPRAEATPDRILHFAMTGEDIPLAPLARPLPPSDGGRGEVEDERGYG
jgi:ribose transport system ATP-binding protein